jgi:hypothetical protein
MKKSKNKCAVTRKMNQTSLGLAHVTDAKYKHAFIKGDRVQRAISVQPPRHIANKIDLAP